MLEAKVPDLRTPSEEEGVEGEHGGDVAHADVADVDTPGVMISVMRMILVMRVIMILVMRVTW